MVVGLALAAGLAVLLVAAPVSPSEPTSTFARAGGEVFGRLKARWIGRHHVRRLHRASPDVMEVVGLALGSGFDVAGALGLVRDCGPPAFEGIVARALGELGAGVPRRHALVRLGEASASSLGSMVDVLLAAEREGAPVAMVLDRLADEAATQRRALALERARRTPVLLLAPLVLCSLPAVLLGTVVPLLVITLGDAPV